MKRLPEFLMMVASFVRWLVVAIVLCLLFIFSCQSLRAQSVPLVRAQHDSFVSYYDIERHNPALVVYPLEFAHFAGKNKISGRHFKMDTQLPRPRVKDSDYSKTGYVRGHLCSAGDRDSNKKWLKETYLTSNMVPMTMVCNSGPFKMIEDSCRALAMAGHRLIIGRLPLYRDIQSFLQNVSHTRVAIQVPDAFLCLARCQTCDLRYSGFVLQSGTNPPECVIQFMNDPRVSVLLQNIFGSWSREEYETITR